LLFNNAGVSAMGVALEAMPVDYWERVISINLTSVVLGIQSVLARVRAQRLEGHIVNTSSAARLGVAVAGGGAYVATKSALVALSEGLEAELRDAGIAVSVVCPGPVRSELWRTSRAALDLGEAAPPSDRRPDAGYDRMRADMAFA
jgi:NAD(P)-dependent dehydrogenase (short-subunit alcohol dehydrogenase family)